MKNRSWTESPQAVALVLTLLALFIVLAVKVAKANEVSTPCSYITETTYGCSTSQTKTETTTIATTTVTTTPDAYNIDLTDTQMSTVRQMANEYAIDMDLVLAVMYKESRFDENAVSSTHDYGIMQINKSNHGWLKQTLGLTDVLGFTENLRCGIYLLDTYLDKYDNVTQALMCYHYGESGAKAKWHKRVYHTQYTDDVERYTNDLKTYKTIK
jgi:hypothetical protein